MSNYVTEKQILISALEELQTKEICLNKNEGSESKHEKYVGDFLFDKLKAEGYIYCENNITKIQEKLKNNTKLFIHHPNGSKNSPDFRLLDGSKIVIDIEAKSSKSTNKPVWNGGRVKENTIYIFSRNYSKTSREYKKINRTTQTTFFLHSDTKLQILYDVVDKYDLAKSESVAGQVNVELKASGSKHRYYHRSMYNDGNNYFDKNRNTREQNVIKYISSL